MNWFRRHRMVALALLMGVPALLGLASTVYRAGWDDIEYIVISFGGVALVMWWLNRALHRAADDL